MGVRLQGLGLHTPASAGRHPEQKTAPVAAQMPALTFSGRSANAFKSYASPQIKFGYGSLAQEAMLPNRVKAFAAKQSFRLDPFQTTAMTALDNGKSVVVPTPTSSGKTLVAEFAINEVTDPESPNYGKKLAYTTPRKALSNEKYEDLVKQYGAENIGLMTGDVTINRDAPVLVMTTEVLRNMFYNPNTEDSVQKNLQYTVFDECHFIDDPDRGVVWEESMLYVPDNIQQIHLSATIENADQYTQWLDGINEQDFQLVPYQTHDPKQQRQGRPVPLQVEYLSPEGSLTPVLKAGSGGQNPAFKRAFQRGRFDMVKAVDALRDKNRLPAILFVFGRNACERFANDVSNVISGGLTTPDERQKINILVDRFKKEYPWLDQSPLLNTLPQGVGYHHGGMLPYEKKLVEVLMKKGLLKAVFATDTLAAGINVPAKTVVLTTYDRNIDGMMTPISDSDYQQIIGRAGRRGMYNTGYAVMMHPRDNNKNRLLDLINARPNSVNSQFRVTPGMALSLIEGRSPNEIEALLNRTFAAYQNNLQSAQASSASKSRKRRGKRQATKPETGPVESFRQMRRYLQKGGFLTGNKNIEQVALTPAGTLAAALPSDHNLLLAKAANTGVFNNLSAAELATVISTTVSQSKKSGDDNSAGDRFTNQPALQDAMSQLETLQGELLSSSNDYPLVRIASDLGTDHASIVRKWCETGDFSAIMATPAPGDVVNVIRRTANLLGHIADSDLDDAKYGKLKQKAREAVALLLADPLPKLVTPKLIDTEL